MSDALPAEEVKKNSVSFRARDRQTMLTLTDRLIVLGYNVDAKQDTPRVSTHPWILVATPTGEVEEGELDGVLQGLDAEVEGEDDE